MRPKMEYNGISDDASIIYIMNISSSSFALWPQLETSDNKQIKRIFALYSLTAFGIIVDFIVTVAIIFLCRQLFYFFSHHHHHHHLLLNNVWYWQQQ